MTTELELVAKIFTVAGSVFALYKVIAEFVFAKKSRLREEFKFIKDFIGELEPDTHPFIIEKGYLAITGDETLKASEIKYLLSLAAPAQALKKYSASRQYVEFIESTEDTSPRVEFREKYTVSKRVWVKRRNLLAYGIFATLAFSPIVFASELFGSNWQSGLALIAMALFSFGPLAYTSLAEYSRVCRSEELMLMQRTLQGN